MSGRIITVSPNTSTDRVSVVDGFAVGGTFRTVYSFDQAGGSGAHAASVATELGGDALAIAAIGGGNGLRWNAAAKRQRLPTATIDIKAENRSSFVLIDRQIGKIAEVVDAGPALTRRESRALLHLVEACLEDAGLLVLSGSLPPGVDDDFYAHCIDLATAGGIATVVDTHSAPLRHALAKRPWLIKPNLDEFHQLTDTPATTLSDRVPLLHSLVGECADVVLLSMEDEGALLATSDGCWHLTPPDQPVTLPETDAINPVGCGDALVGAFCYQWLRSHDLIESARWGVAAAHVNLGKVEVPSSPKREVEALVHEVGVRLIERPMQSALSVPEEGRTHERRLPHV